jgi:hypothetical protein
MGKNKLTSQDLSKIVDLIKSEFGGIDSFQNTKVGFWQKFLSACRDGILVGSKNSCASLVFGIGSIVFVGVLLFIIKSTFYPCLTYPEMLAYWFTKDPQITKKILDYERLKQAHKQRQKIVVNKSM